MKSLHAIALYTAIAAISGSALAANTGSLNEFPSRILPVLVQVNAQGKVTDASPATQLPPALQRLLLQNLSERITGPAVVHGKPVSSQFVMNLALKVTPRAEGDYYANFAYVSTSPVLPGSWYWVHIDGHRLALANRNGSRPSQNRPFPIIWDPPFERAQRPIYTAPTPLRTGMNNNPVRAPEPRDVI